MAFERRELTREFLSEGAAFADLDRDGHADVVAGPSWYAGPDFRERHALHEPRAFDPAGYSDAFFAFPHDVDGDGWMDVVHVGFPGEAATWLQNPRGAAGPWPRHLAVPHVDNESPAFTDLTGDGRPELVFHAGGRLGWAGPDPRDPRAPWAFHALSEDLGYGRFTHGLGVGDIDGDGRADVLTRDGWWRQPESLEGDPAWERHAYPFAQAGGAQMLVLDADGDGDSDVVTSLAAHGFGLSWFEQVRPAGAITFVEHAILPADGAPGAAGLAFAELHALALADMDGDGLADLVTGKRFWSHGAAGDPELGAPATLAWFRLARGPGGVTWEPHVIDRDSGVGTQVVAGDVDGDARPDVVVGNKNGAFVFLQRDAPPPPAVSPLGFERGDLSGWHATGEAFALQPVYGDAPAGRGREPSRHAGRFWIGGYERLGDGPTGTLTSDPFPVEEPFASFLAGGGAGRGVRIELLDEGAAVPFFASGGANRETLQRVVVDLSARVGRRIAIRLVDEESGGWGHVNFDDFTFHDRRPEFPRDPTVPPILPWDPPLAAGLPPAEAARAMTVADGLRVELVA
ncbi:MAG: VCBS repeat-containing protein, partial [Planctomycetes bacterium]|nr:VCBS repeat-containing protein [Planctomycetota bacterium]